MKKSNLLVLTLAAMTLGASAFASQSAPAQAEKKQEATAAKPSAEQEFASKLNDQNRKAFNGMTAEQKKAAMAMTCDGSCPAKKAASANEAVEKVAKEQAAPKAEAAHAAKAEKPATAEKPVASTPAAQKPANAPAAK